MPPKGRETVTGRSETSAISEGNNLVSTWSEGLSKQFGLTKSAADEWARAAFINGGFDASLGAQLGGSGAKITAAGGTSDTNGQKFTTSADERLQQAADFLKSQSQSSQASETRDSFFRATATSSDSEVQGLTSRRDASLTESRTFAREAGRLAEAGDRYDKSMSFSSSDGHQWTADQSQDYREFVDRELSQSQSLRDSGYNLSMVGRLSPLQQEAKRSLEARYERSMMDQMRSELQPIVPLGPSTIPLPSSRTEAGVSDYGDRIMSSAAAAGPKLDLGNGERDAGVESQVAGRLERGSRNSTELSNRADQVGSAAREMADDLKGKVQQRNEAQIYETMPGADTVKDVAGSIGRAIGGPPSFNSRPYAASLGIRVKPGTNLSRTDTHMKPAFEALAEETKAMGLRPPMITSARDREHKRGSLHPKGRAIDTRANDLNVRQGQDLEDRLQRRLGPDYFVDFETFSDKPDNNHIHIEYDPKRRRKR